MALRRFPDSGTATQSSDRCLGGRRRPQRQLLPGGRRGSLDSASFYLVGNFVDLHVVAEQPKLRFRSPSPVRWKVVEFPITTDHTRPWERMNQQCSIIRGAPTHAFGFKGPREHPGIAFPPRAPPQRTTFCLPPHRPASTKTRRWARARAHHDQEASCDPFLGSGYRKRHRVAP